MSTTNSDPDQHTAEAAPVDGVGAPSPAEPEAVAALRERLLRALADAENARRRAEKARSEGWRAGVAELAGRLIPGLDSLDLAVRAVPQPDQDPTAFAKAVQEGLVAARRELLEALENAGVERLEPAGQAFDAQAHEAIAARPDPSVPSGQVLDVVQAGYRLAGERLIRPARVIVSSGASAEPRGVDHGAAEGSGAASDLT